MSENITGDTGQNTIRQACRHGKWIGDDCGLCELQGPDRRDTGAREPDAWVGQEYTEWMRRAFAKKDLFRTLPVYIGSAPSSDATRLREAAQALADKLDAIVASDEYIAVFALAQNMLGPYRGPSFENELRELRAALSASEAGPGGDPVELANRGDEPRPGTPQAG